MTGKKPPHCLPGAEPHIPETEESALLVFGYDHKNPDIKNYYQPTDAAPGSPEKIAVLHARALAGFPLWHPSDRADFNGWKGSLPTSGSDS